nr:adenylate/guanylate cyclase domain-containing protein [Rhodococcus triatomae]
MRAAAKALERIGEVNRHPSLVSGLRKLRHTLPGDPSFGDPLSTAGPGSARALARVADRFLDDQPGASREVSLGALQVWQAVLERVGRGRGTSDVTIVFTDLVGFSTWSLPAGDAATLALLKDVARAVETPFRARGGHVVKRLGDGVMAVFPSPDRALEAVFEARDALADVEVDGYCPRMRVGIHTGVPRKVGADWIGVDVTIAARMMELGADGNVVASASALDGLYEGTLERLGLVARPWRRPLFGSPPNGVPPELGIWRVRRA